MRIILTYGKCLERGFRQSSERHSYVPVAGLSLLQRIDSITIATVLPIQAVIACPLSGSIIPSSLVVMEL